MVPVDAFVRTLGLLPISTNRPRSMVQMGVSFDGEGDSAQMFVCAFEDDPGSF